VAYRTTSLCFLKMARMDLDAETETQLESVDQTDGQNGLAGQERLDSANSGQQLEMDEFAAMFNGPNTEKEPNSLPGTPAPVGTVPSLTSTARLGWATCKGP
jgi:hypothetical protein